MQPSSLNPILVTQTRSVVSKVDVYTPRVNWHSVTNVVRVRCMTVYTAVLSPLGIVMNILTGVYLLCDHCEVIFFKHNRLWEMLFVKNLQRTWLGYQLSCMYSNK